MSVMSQNQFSETIEKCTGAIKSKNMKVLNTLLTLMPSRQWCSVLNKSGNTLLQESIKNYNKEAFDVLLKFQDSISLEKTNVFGETALMLAMDVNGRRHFHTPQELETLEYFAIELIKYGVFIHGVYNDDTFLDRALILKSMKVAELLLEKKIQVNFRDKNGNTSLHKILVIPYYDCGYEQNIDEFVFLLLCYGADPFIENNDGYLPFEYAVEYNHTLPIQNILINYTFDEHTVCKIHVGVLFKLAQTNHQFFSELLHNTRITFIIKKMTKMTTTMHMRALRDTFNCLFDMDIGDLRIVINKHSALIKKIKIKILDDIKTVPETEYFQVQLEHIRYKYPWKSFSDISKIDHLNALFESNIKYYLQEVLSLSSSANIIFRDIIAKNTQNDASQLLTFLLSYGLKFTKREYDEIYLSYGYCELFKLMLLIGSDERDYLDFESPMCRFIYEINFNLEEVFQKYIENCIEIENLMELLDYFTNETLTKELLDIAEKQEGDYKQELLKRIAMQPEVPSLLELSRNASRKYIVDKFNVKKESQFYSMVNWLPISRTYKQIITYETKLYNYVI